MSQVRVSITFVSVESDRYNHTFHSQCRTTIYTQLRSIHKYKSVQPLIFLFPSSLPPLNPHPSTLSDCETYIHLTSQTLSKLPPRPIEMSGSDSRAAETVPTKDQAPELSERQRSNKRLVGLGRATQPTLVPSDKPTHSSLNRFDAPQSVLRQSPISAHSVSLIDRRVHRTSMTPISSPEQSAAYKKKLMGQRARNAARATRREEASAREASSRTPVITEATSNGE